MENNNLDNASGQSGSSPIPETPAGDQTDTYSQQSDNREQQTYSQANTYSYGQNGYSYNQTNNAYQPGASSGYQPQNPRTPANPMAIASLVLGILSLILCCCAGIGGIVFGALGIIFAILSKKGKAMEVLAKVGLGLSIAGVVLGVITAAFVFISALTGDVYDDYHSGSFYYDDLYDFYD